MGQDPNITELTCDFFGVLIDRIAEHIEIVRAVRTGQALRCEALMTRHVDDAYQRLTGATPAVSENA